MVALEKAGIPAVGIVARSFVRAWQSCVDGWGQPSTAFVTIPHATTGQQADFIRKMVDEQIDAIIRNDPFVSRGLADFRIIEFRASQRADDIQKRIDGA